MPHINPFQCSYGSAQCADDRLDAVKSFNLQQCNTALLIPGLQKAVETAINRRINKLKKEQKVR
jgi:hypothetical protein